MRSARSNASFHELVVRTAMAAAVPHRKLWRHRCAPRLRARARRPSTQPSRNPEPPCRTRATSRYLHPSQPCFCAPATRASDRDGPPCPLRSIGAALAPGPERLGILPLRTPDSSTPRRDSTEGTRKTVACTTRNADPCTRPSSCASSSTRCRDLVGTNRMCDETRTSPRTCAC